MIKEFSNNGSTFLAVDDIPNLAKDLTFSEGSNHDDHGYLPSLHFDINSKPKLLLLPEGQWKLIGRFNELSEEQSEEMVQKIFFGCYAVYAHNGNGIQAPQYGEYTFDSALASLNSRLHSLGLNPDNTVLLQEL